MCCVHRGCHTYTAGQKPEPCTFVATLTRVSPMPSPPTLVISAVRSPSRDAPVSAFAQLPPPSICMSSHTRCKRQVSTPPVDLRCMPILPLQLASAAKHDGICSLAAPLCASSHLALGSVTLTPSSLNPGCRGRGLWAGTRRHWPACMHAKEYATHDLLSGAATIACWHSQPGTARHASHAAVCAPALESVRHVACKIDRSD